MLPLNIVSKYRAPLYGFAILYVMLFHASAIDKVDYSFGYEVLKPFATFMNAGNVGVDIFLFMSGICLYFSFCKNSDIHAFIKKRLSRIFIPLLIIDGLYWLIRIVIIQQESIFEFINRVFLLRFWITGDGTVWYASLIVALYFAYPYIYHCIYSGRSQPWKRGIALMLLVYMAIISIYIVAPTYYGLVEIALTRIPVFIFGCMMGRYVYEGKQLNRWWLVAALIGVLIFYGVLHFDILHGPLRRFFYLIGGVSLSYVLAVLFAAINQRVLLLSLPLRALTYMGQISFELYLSHIMANQVLRLTPFYEEGNLIEYFGVLFVAIIVADLAGKAVAKATKRISNLRFSN